MNSQLIAIIQEDLQSVVIAYECLKKLVPCKKKLMLKSLLSSCTFNSF